MELDLFLSLSLIIFGTLNLFIYKLWKVPFKNNMYSVITFYFISITQILFGISLLITKFGILNLYVII